MIDSGRSPANKLSIKEAREIALDILYKAERERKEYAEKEAAQGASLDYKSALEYNL